MVSCLSKILLIAPVNRHQLEVSMIIKTPISSAQQASRKLIQRSVKLLNTPRSTANTSLPSQVKLFPSTQHDHVNTRSSDDTLTDRDLTANRSLSTDKHVDETTSAPNLRQPLANIPKLPPQQTLMPQENPFDITVRSYSPPRKRNGTHIQNSSFR